MTLCFSPEINLSTLNSNVHNALPIIFFLMTVSPKKKKQGGVFVVKLYSVEPVFSSQPVLKGYPAIFCG